MERASLGKVLSRTSLTAAAVGGYMIWEGIINPVSAGGCSDGEVITSDSNKENHPDIYKELEAICQASSPGRKVDHSIDPRCTDVKLEDFYPARIWDTFGNYYDKDCFPAEAGQIMLGGTIVATSIVLAIGLPILSALEAVRQKRLRQ